MAILLNSYQQTTTFTPQRFNPVVVTENERVKVVVACFEPGQYIPVHQPDVDLTLTILEGEATVAAGVQEEQLGPGCLVFVPAGEARGIKAETRLVILHVVTPPPTFEDHTEVMAGLKRGSWR
ncbi:MAG: cupin domain-containing protein [Anaerolineaceae bacterium]|nr:cupin domain-containing protein [Anaerolineaceae bacterium]